MATNRSELLKEKEIAENKGITRTMRHKLRNKTSYIPHQGLREVVRRKRQITKGILTVN
jgi:hypothetical protein